MFTKFITQVCKILDIPVPNITYDNSFLLSDTMLAICSDDGNAVCIRPAENPSFDNFFAISHELRHVWQIKTDREHYLGSYRSREYFDSVDDYNLQLAEIDANAFAGVVMVNFFGLRPLFQGLSDDVRNLIYEHMDVIGGRV